VTTLTVEPQALRHAAARCRRTAEELRAAAADVRALTPDLGAARTDELVRHLLRDAATSVAGLAEGVEHDASTLTAAADAYDRTDGAVARPQPGPTPSPAPRG
jgi:hypothetical protein